MLDGKSVTTHPLFVEGHQYAGTLFISVLVDVVQDVVPRWSGRGPRPPVKPKHVVLANRGFPIHVREAVEAGHRPIDPSDVKQLLVDYYATYPRRAQNRHTDYMQLQALLNGEWVEDERLTAANTLPLKGTPHCASEELVSEGLETASLALLFEPGNRQVSTMWVRVLRKYRAVHAQFANAYGLTPEHEEAILEAEIGVPVSVHQYLMYLIAKRLERAESPKLIRAYQALLEMPESRFDEQQFVEPVEIPNQDWLVD